MTDPTTAAPSGYSAPREAAVELEDLLTHLDLDGALDPDTFDVVLPGRDTTRRYHGHIRTLRLARTALRDLQRRRDAARGALATQGPEDVSTTDVEAIARLAQTFAQMDPTQTAVGIDYKLANVSPPALAAVLRAGLASVVGDATPNTVDAEPAAETAPEPARAEVSEPSVRAAVQYSADGRRLTVSAEGIYERTQVDVVAPGTVLEPVLDRPVLEVGYPAVPVPDLDPEPSSPDPVAPAEASMSSVYGAMVFENPVQAAVARTLGLADGAVTDAGELVRSLARAVLDEAADHLRATLRQPRVTPLLVIDPDHTVWTEDSVVGMADRYRRTVADAAADELRILARLDSARP